MVWSVGFEPTKATNYVSASSPFWTMGPAGALPICLRPQFIITLYISQVKNIFVLCLNNK